MTAPHTTVFDHTLGTGTLADAMRQWKPSSHTERRVLTDELLNHARAASNVLTNVLEHRAVMLDDGGGRDIVGADDLWALSDLLSSLLETITVVVHTNGDGCDHLADPDAVSVILENGLLNGGAHHG